MWQSEESNPRSINLDRMDTLQMLQLMNEEDQKVPEAIKQVLPVLAQVVDQAAERLDKGGRLIYMGAGTSGRIGLLDAVECPPTFGISPDQVIGVLAGGLVAFVKAKEGEEDRQEAGVADLEALQVHELDTVIGLAASGHTPYTVAGLTYARQMGALTVAVATVSPCLLATAADLAILPLVGPEVLTGSTRLKAGTAQKLVLNMISTGVMVRLGKVYGNYMVDLLATNHKLMARATRIVQDVLAVDEQTAASLLTAAEGKVKLAIVMGSLQIEKEQAQEALHKAGGNLRQIL